MPDLYELKKALETSIIEGYGGMTKHKPGSNHASKIGHPCAYFLWARRARWEEVPAIDEAKAGIFAIGREHERAIIAILSAQGWNVTRTQAQFYDEELDIGGKMDFELSHEMIPSWKRPIPTEFKSASNTYFDTIQHFDDMLTSRVKWVRLWPVQALFYAHLDDQERAIVAVLMRDKITGRPRFLPTEVHEHGELIEEVSERVRLVNECLTAEVEPEPMSFCPMWCPECEMKAFCPAMRSISIEPGIHAIQEPSRLDASADVYVKAKPEKKMCDDSWKDIKAIVAHHGAFEGPPHTSTVLVGRRFKYTVKRTAKTAKLTVDPIA